MTIDTYTFPLANHSVFIRGEQRISGQQWANECLTLAQDIKGYSEQNWLLYQDDFYQYSQCFFALLLADKHIVLAQSEQCERFKQAAKYADISIGCISTEDDKNEPLLPHFHPKCQGKQQNETLIISNNTLTLNANTRITLFTSGSTGEAKAIKKYWYQLANEVHSLQRMFAKSLAQTCILSTVTHKHIYGLLFKLIWPVFTNKQILCDTIEYPEQVEHYCQIFNQVTLISSPSYLARTRQQLSAQAIASIQNVFCSGGALSLKVANDFLVTNQQVITEIYGSTETGGIAWRKQAENVQWQLFPEHKVTLAKDNTLLLNSPFLVENETYKTDDSVELNGRFFNLIGRVDRIIKLHEKRLSLDEMEQALNSLSNISACHCFMLARPKSKTVLVAVIELETDQRVPDDITQKKQLVNECKINLLSLFEPSLLPRKWRFVQSLPFNRQGKLVKADLVNLFSRTNA